MLVRGARSAGDLAIDLGTANTLVCAPDDGILLAEPSVIAVHTADRSVVAVGREAKAMLGRTPGNVMVVRPLRDGAIADFDGAHRMLEAFLAKLGRRSWRRPRVVVAVSSGITSVERRALSEAVIQAGAREVFLVEAPIAAAAGAGMPIQEPGGYLVADIGGGTTEVAVLSLGGIVVAGSVRVAGAEMDEAIVQHLRKRYNLLIGERRAEEIKIALGTVYPMNREPCLADVKGRDAIDGLPKTVTVTDDEVRDALREPAQAVVEAVRACLEDTPPELAADLVDRGLVITGGGALIPGMVELLRSETGLPVTLGDDPLTCTAQGAARLLDHLSLLNPAR
jgi:rod shape-determining protein MreB and related proteins